ISTVNLLTSSSTAWEHGDYNNIGGVDDSNKQKIRLKTRNASELTPNLDYTFSAGIAENYTAIGINVWASVLHLYYEDLTSPVITRIVDRKLMNEPIIFNSGEPSFSESTGIDSNNSYVVFVLEVADSIILNTDSESLDSYKLMLNKGKNKMPYTFHDPDITERISNTEATLTIHADSIEQKAEKSELLNYVDKQEYSNKVGSLETSIDNITGRVEETEGTLDKVTGDIVEVSEKYAQLEIRADGIESEVSRVEEDVNGKITSANTQIQQNADSIKHKVDTLDYNRDKHGIISDIAANRTEINQLSDEIELRVTKEEFENLEIGGRNLLPNTSQDPVLYSKTSWDWNSQRFRLDDLDRLGIDVGTELTLKVYIKNPTQDARAFIQFTSKTPTYRQYYGNYVYEGESGWSTVTIKIAQADLNNFNYLDIAVRGKLSTSGTVE